MDELFRKAAANKLFEMICYETDIFSMAHRIDISSLTNSVITEDDIKDILEGLQNSGLIKNVAYGGGGTISCQMTTKGLEKFHEKVND